VIELKKINKIIAGIAIVTLGIIALLLQPYLMLAATSLICIPSGLSLILYAII